MRGRTFCARVAVGLVLAVTAVGQAAASDPAPTRSVTYQMTATHEGSQTGDRLSPPLVKTWSRSLGAGPVSYPLIAEGRAFVTVAHGQNQSYGTDLYALNLATGNTAWGPVNLGGTYYVGGIAYDGGQVFAVTYDGLLRAFDEANGALRWQQQMPGQYAFTSPPTAFNGRVYLGGAGSGGTLYAVNETDGTLSWTARVSNGDHSAPAATATGIYVSYACNHAYAFEPSNGALLWHHSGVCSGGGGKTVAVHDGRVYTRDYYGDLILDAGNGQEVGRYRSDTVPSFDGGLAFSLLSGTLTAQDAGGQTRWTFRGDGSLSSAPIVDNGYVYLASGRGNVYAVDEATGQPVWTGTVATGVAGPDEQNAWPLVGLAAGDGHLLVPAGGTLTAFESQPDFELQVPSLMPLRPGGDAVASVTVTANRFVNGTLTFTTSGVPSTSQAAVNPSAVSLTPGQTATPDLRVHASLMQLKSFTMTVTACYGDICHSAPVDVRVSAL